VNKNSLDAAPVENLTILFGDPVCPFNLGPSLWGFGVCLAWSKDCRAVMEEVLPFHPFRE